MKLLKGIFLLFAVMYALKEEVTKGSWVLTAITWQK
jgi:hypothetical protein